MSACSIQSMRNLSFILVFLLIQFFLGLLSMRTLKLFIQFAIVLYDLHALNDKIETVNICRGIEQKKP